MKSSENLGLIFWLRRQLANSALILFLVTVDPLQKAMSQLDAINAPCIVLISYDSNRHRRALERRFGFTLAPLFAYGIPERFV